jgi:hypothetical protein
MAVPKVTCPGCDSLLKFSSALAPGDKVRCPKCDFIFPIPAPGSEPDRPAAKSKVTPRPPTHRRFRDDYLEEQEEAEAAAEAAANKNLPKKSAKFNYVLFAAVGGGGITVGAFLVYLLLQLTADGRTHKASKNEGSPTKDKAAVVAPRINLDKYEQIRFGMRLAEIENILGKGTKSPSEPKLNKKDDETYTSDKKKARPTYLFGWDDDDRQIVVGFAPKEASDEAVFKAYFYKENSAQKVVSQAGR